MAVATDQQVQNYVDQRIRPRAEQIRALLVFLQDDKAAVDDVYAALTQESPTWTDGRTDGPPHLLLGSDVLAVNTFGTRLIQILTGTVPSGQEGAAISGVSGQYPIVLKACVRPPGL